MPRNEDRLIDETGKTLGLQSISGTRILKVFEVGTFKLPSGADSFAVTYPSATQEVYTFRSGGIAGSILATWTINYTDSTKASLLNGVFS